MQILCVYQHPTNTMVEFDYLQYQLVRYLSDSTLLLDTMPIIPRQPKYQAKKPRSSYADNPHIQTT